MSMNEKSGAINDAALETLANEVFQDINLSPRSIFTALQRVREATVKHLPSGDVGKLREALIECRDHLEAERRRIGSSVMDNERIERVRAALASVPANPPQVDTTLEESPERDYGPSSSKCSKCGQRYDAEEVHACACELDDQQPQHHED